MATGIGCREYHRVAVDAAGEFHECRRGFDVVADQHAAIGQSIPSPLEFEPHSVEGVLAVMKEKAEFIGFRAEARQYLGAGV